MAGTGHIIYPLLPVIYEIAHESGIRPERPMAVATIASQQAITASPVSAATAAMIGLFAEKGLTQGGLLQILIICVPATLTGVVAAAFISMFVGKDLKDDPEYQARLASGDHPAAEGGLRAAAAKAGREAVGGHLPHRRGARRARGHLPRSSPVPGAKAPLAMPTVIAIVMLAVAAVMLVVAKAPVDEVPKTATCERG